MRRFFNVWHSPYWNICTLRMTLNCPRTGRFSWRRESYRRKTLKKDRRIAWEM